MRSRDQAGAAARGGAARLPDAVLFDFDGVIVDTEPLHFRAFAEVFAPMGIPVSWEEYLDTYVGFDDRGVFAGALRRAGRTAGGEEVGRFLAAKAEAFARAARESGLRPYPGVAELLAEIGGRGVPCGLCSGALPGDIGPILEATALAGAFEVIVTAADVPASKPDPACYRLAIDRLRTHHAGRTIRAARSLAIEDTAAGIEAARGAGLRVAAVATTCGRDALAGAAVVLRSLDRTDLQQLWNRACAA